MEVARHLDQLYRKLDMAAEAHQHRRIDRYYEDLFCSVYAACM